MKRIDHQLNIKYDQALNLLERTFEIKTRKCGIFLVDENYIRLIWEHEFKKKYGKLGKKMAKSFAKVTNGTYDLERDEIYIKQGCENLFQTIIHETLHSLSVFNSKNSPVWISEGLTKFLTEIVFIENGISYSKDLYHRDYIDRWKKISDKAGIKEIIKIYFSKDIKKARNGISNFETKQNLQKG